MVPWSDGVVAVFDIHNAAHLLRVKDGTLLATISSTLDGGWAAISRQGAVDASADGRSAFLTNVSGTDPVGGSSWLGWDRFAVTDLVSRAARGEVVPPPIAADVLKTGTLAAKDGHAAVPAGR